MNKRIREIIKIRNEKAMLKRKYNLTIQYLEKFLKDSDGIFKFEKSINSINNLKDYLLELKSVVQDLYVQDERLFEELRGICSHDILFNNYDQVVCPLCEKWFWKTDKLNGKYVIDTELNQSSKWIQRYIKFLINYDESDFDEKLNEFLENLQDECDVIVLRR